ncbi:DUF2225 domain-containing protein [Thermotalea metallivorans]|uniref:DUF2225 domain-containing protein n=1 Tax=Thermotalea metallivorans TaxID=520762 RepID=A0A140LEF5_9FIRM|nr:DUF2225 domain-containing protein [Thermotalea metallivorans]KXG78930.1 hypothetical protein AN619_00890 [Thermotalea metallivorans]
MKNALYDKEVTCPLCKNIFRTKKVRTSSTRIEKRDTDFCTYYTSENPMFYGVFVCPMCGYAAMESTFHEINGAGKKAIEENITRRWTQRSFGGERTIQEAIEAYKLALLCGQLINQKKGVIGNICLRIAWLYRYANDPKETDFLKHAVRCFEQAFVSEPLPIGNLDEVTLMYLIGEIHRLIGNYEEAIEWFSKAVGNPAIKTKKKIDTLAREQWRLAKESFKNKKNQEQAG